MSCRPGRGDQTYKNVTDARHLFTNPLTCRIFHQDAHTTTQSGHRARRGGGPRKELSPLWPPGRRSCKTASDKLKAHQSEQTPCVHAALHPTGQSAVDAQGKRLFRQASFTHAPSEQNSFAAQPASFTHSTQSPLTQTSLASQVTPAQGSTGIQLIANIAETQLRRIQTRNEFIVGFLHYSLAIRSGTRRPHRWRNQMALWQC